MRDVQRNVGRRELWDDRESRFLFAVVRDVQRNAGPASHPGPASGFYSLSCETYSGTSTRRRPRCRRATSFLFAVVRDVQRNIAVGLVGIVAIWVFYSLSCETYSGTSAENLAEATGRKLFYSLSCETYSGTLSSPAGL